MTTREPLQLHSPCRFRPENTLEDIRVEFLPPLYSNWEHYIPLKHKWDEMTEAITSSLTAGSLKLDDDTCIKWTTKALDDGSRDFDLVITSKSSTVNWEHYDEMVAAAMVEYEARKK